MFFVSPEKLGLSTWEVFSWQRRYISQSEFKTSHEYKNRKNVGFKTSYIDTINVHNNNNNNNIFIKHIFIHYIVYIQTYNLIFITKS